MSSKPDHNLEAQIGTQHSEVLEKGVSVNGVKNAHSSDASQDGKLRNDDR